MSTGDGQDADGASTWTQPRFVIAAVVVALIAVLGVVLAITGPADGDDDPAPRADPPSAPPTAEPVGDSACGLEPGDQTIPVVAPPDTNWELVGTVAAPTAPDTIGPGVVDDGLRSCFAHSPLGALYAAVNFVATTSDPNLRMRAVRELAASGGGQERAIAALESAAAPSAPTAGAQVAGFSLLNYDDAAAVVDLAIRVDTSGYVHLPLSLRWEDADWKVVLPPTGEPYDAIQPLPDLTGYSPWSGA